MKNKLIYLLAILMVISGITSCKKEVGYGGNNAIKGTLKLRKFNSDFTTLKSEGPLADEYVYIVFQDGKGYGDRVKTSFDGSFSFTHLKKGKYKIFAYSKDSTMQSTGDFAVIKEVEIKKKKSLVDAGEIKICTNSEVQGTSVIRGKVLAHSNGQSYYATNEKVFLKLEGEITYTKFVYTDEEGEFKFTEVPTGFHKVYAFSKNSSDTGAPTIPVVVDVQVLSNNQIVVLNDLEIND